ncbi:hypothetical protein EV180_004056 [Coemansia sp. RSA 518]|nr:hypothetical protein EV180_004056 [Coemansia sp. RSA 518]
MGLADLVGVKLGCDIVSAFVGVMLGCAWASISPNDDVVLAVGSDIATAVAMDSWLDEKKPLAMPANGDRCERRGLLSINISVIESLDASFGAELWLEAADAAIMRDNPEVRLSDSDPRVL